jgi:hypothetical protein
MSYNIPMRYEILMEAKNNKFFIHDEPTNHMETISNINFEI